MTILEVVIGLRDAGPQETRCGICLNLYEQHREALEAFEMFLYESGYDEVYPVECNLMGMSLEAASDYYRRCGDKWVGDHGAARMRLLNDFINWLET